MFCRASFTITTLDGTKDGRTEPVNPYRYLSPGSLLLSRERLQTIITHLTRPGGYDRIDGRGRVLSAQGEQPIEVIDSVVRRRPRIRIPAPHRSRTAPPVPHPLPTRHLLQPGARRPAPNRWSGGVRVLAAPDDRIGDGSQPLRPRLRHHPPPHSKPDLSRPCTADQPLRTAASGVIPRTRLGLRRAADRAGETRAGTRGGNPSQLTDSQGFPVRHHNPQQCSPQAHERWWLPSDVLESGIQPTSPPVPYGTRIRNSRHEPGRFAARKSDVPACADGGGPDRGEGRGELRSKCRQRLGGSYDVSRSLLWAG